MRIMSPPDIRVDMNLFRVLDAIYTHGGISGAARVLHLTQPAITHSLNRLRELLNDPLFVRQGNRMVATHKTRMIMPKVQLHLNGLQAAIHLQETFEPVDMELHFTVGVHDPFEWIVLPLLFERLEKEAPRVKVVSQRATRNEIEKELTSGSLDLAIDRRLHTSPRIHAEHLVDEPLVVVMRRGHPLASRPIERSDYFAARHVSVTPGSKLDAIDLVLDESGQARRIGFVCQHYFGACQIVARNDWLLTMPRSYAYELSRVLPVTVRPLPIRFKPIPIEMYWHESKNHDRSHEWFRRLIHETLIEKAVESDRLIALPASAAI